MLDPNSHIFMLRGELFKYQDGTLFMYAEGGWYKHGSYEKYESAFEAAEKVVAD